MKPDITKTFTYPIYCYRLRVTLTDTSVCQTARMMYPDLPGETTTEPVEAIHIWRDNLQMSHIILPYGAGINCIVHEVFHFVWRLMESIGAKLENEILAYHLGYSVERLCAWIAKVDPVDIVVETVEKKVPEVVDIMANL